jgi:hypothetical protein
MVPESNGNGVIVSVGTACVGGHCLILLVTHLMGGGGWGGYLTATVMVLESNAYPASNVPKWMAREGEGLL